MKKLKVLETSCKCKENWILEDIQEAIEALGEENFESEIVLNPDGTYELFIRKVYFEWWKRGESIGDLLKTKAKTISGIDDSEAWAN